MKDEEIIDNSQISFAIMHLAEYFLAYSILNKNRNIKVILMDRTLSGDQASLISKTSKRANWERKSSLIDYEIDEKKITPQLLEYGRYRIYSLLHYYLASNFRWCTLLVGSRTKKIFRILFHHNIL